MRVLLTGGAGFIGSHLADSLIAQGDEVLVLDNLSSGRMDNLSQSSTNPRLKFVEADLKDFEDWSKVFDGVKLVYHFAANPEVQVGEVDPAIHFQENLYATFKLLDAMRKSQMTKSIVFASTSTVYGEASQLPTPEDYGPLLPISTYGATKLGCEVLISSYAGTHGMRGLILRFGNCVGSRAKHGVIVDFIGKLRSDPTSLEILGDGSQVKSYVHIQDCLDATLLLTKHFYASGQGVEVFNLSSEDQVNVKRIAEIVTDEMGLNNVRLKFTGGVDGGRGWFGDVKTMSLSIEKLHKLGWKPKLNSEGAVRRATRELLELSSPSK